MEIIDFLHVYISPKKELDFVFSRTRVLDKIYYFII